MGGEPLPYVLPDVNDDEYELISLLATFPETVKSAVEKLEPFYVTRYAIDVASAFNKFYFDCRIIGEKPDVCNFRLDICRATLTVLTNALTLLGIKIPERM